MSLFLDFMTIACMQVMCLCIILWLKTDNAVWGWRGLPALLLGIIGALVTGLENKFVHGYFLACLLTACITMLVRSLLSIQHSNTQSEA